jgi:hypothetical protein
MLIAIVYLLSIPLNFTEAEDALHYAAYVGDGQQRLHPNHLLYEPISQWLVRLTGGDALSVMQGASLLASLLTLGLLGRIALRLGGGPEAALAAVWGVAGCFAFWLYGLYPDTYALPLPFVLGSVLALLDRRFLLAAGLAATATLIHQSHVLLLPAVLLWLATTGRGLRDGLRFAALFLGITGGVYLLAGRFVLDHGSVFETIAWSRGLASDGPWRPLSVWTPAEGLVGLGTAIWAVFFLFDHPTTLSWIETAFQGRILVEEKHFAQHGLLLGFWPLLILTVVSITAFLALALRAARRPSTVPDRPGLGLILWVFVTYAVGTTLWEATNKEFWIVSLPFLALLVFLRLDLSRRAMRSLAAVAVTTLWACNATGAMVGFTDRGTDHWYETNLMLIERTTARDVVIEDCNYACRGYLRKFVPARVLPLRAFEATMASAPARVIVTPSAAARLRADAPVGRDPLAEAVFDEDLGALVFERGG